MNDNAGAECNKHGETLRGRADQHRLFKLSGGYKAVSAACDRSRRSLGQAFGTFVIV
jgi:hypothetical protein